MFNRKRGKSNYNLKGIKVFIFFFITFFPPLDISSMFTCLSGRQLYPQSCYCVGFWAIAGSCFQFKKNKTIKTYCTIPAQHTTAG